MTGKKRVRRFVLLGFVLALSACGGTKKPPSTVVDACRMKSERPQWFRAMEQTERKYGVPVSVQMATIARESSFRHDARPMKRVGSSIFAREVPRSSAYGYSQALDGTWEWYKNETGRSRASRTNFSDSSDFIGWYMTQNARANGVSQQDAYRQYLAYHDGITGYARGSYRKKSWLPAVARDVEAWAARYDSQLKNCR
ncbi:lytic transglycosylase [Amaricoccus macauensis]|uniref:transglycosylase SLT domain-containing protein n=1 Tax=Amaricoccus macauensis TaxID=57001 RepID=UPI003C7BF547